MTDAPKNTPPHDDTKDELKTAALLATGLVAASAWDMHQTNTNAQQEVKNQALAHEIVVQATADHQREYENITQKRAHEIIEANIGRGLLEMKAEQLASTAPGANNRDISLLGNVMRSESMNGTAMANQLQQSWSERAKLSQNAAKASASERH